MIRTKFYIIGTLLFGQCALAQVPLINITEHFTNTNCSICASRNPGFYSNLNKQQNTLYISYHPSAPYAACKLSQQNKTDNDARTNFYGIYGSTPRLVINGNVVPSSANYSSPALFDAYKNATSLFRISIEQSFSSADSIRVRITIKKEADGTVTGASRLFALLVEDTVWHTGTNGESQHFQVSRKSLFGASGISVKLPQNAGDSATLQIASPWNSIWNKVRINTIAIIQDSASKKTVQSGFSGNVKKTINVPVIKNEMLQLFPNPASETIAIYGQLPLENELIISDSRGRQVCQVINYDGKPYPIQHLASGIYSFVFISAGGKICEKLLIQH